MNHLWYKILINQISMASTMAILVIGNRRPAFTSISREEQRTTFSPISSCKPPSSSATFVVVAREGITLSGLSTVLRCQSCPR